MIYFFNSKNKIIVYDLFILDHIDVQNLEEVNLHLST